MRRLWEKVSVLWDKHHFYASVIVFLFLYFVISVFYLSTPWPFNPDDHFFHFRIASLLRTEGIQTVRDLPWLPLFRNEVDQVKMELTLFHFLLVPFTYFENEILGLKASNVFLACLSLSIVYYTLRKLKIRYAFLYILILTSHYAFLARLLSGRALVLAISFIPLMMYFLVKKKYWPFFITSIICIFLHQASFFFPILIAFIVELARYVAGRSFGWKSILTALLSIVIGMSYLPGYPQIMWMWIERVSSLVISLYQGAQQEMPLDQIEGQELAPHSLKKIFGKSPMHIFFMVFGFAVAIYYYITRRRTRADIEQTGGGTDDAGLFLYAAFIFTVICFSGLILLSGRFQEYLIIYIVFLLAVALWNVTRDKLLSINSSFRKIALPSVSVFLLFFLFHNLSLIAESTKNNDMEPYKKAATWIADNSEKGDLVFLCDWSSFPLYFFYNTKNSYTMALEPKILKDMYPDLFWKWYNIHLYNYDCDKAGDCKDEMENALAAVSKDTEKKLAYESANSHKMVDSITNDFKSRYAVCESLYLSARLSRSEDRIENSFEAVSDENGQRIRVFKFK